jgi:hypothetical protein
MRNSFQRVKVIRYMFLLLFVLIAPNVCGQSSSKQDRDVSTDKPRFGEYKGVKIGTPLPEARQKLGKPEEENKVQESFTISETENVRIFYDNEEKVNAILITYIGKASGAPLPEQVIGEKITANADGSMYKMIQYPKAGFWVAYSRTPGDDPLVMITIQKMPSEK